MSMIDKNTENKASTQDNFPSPKLAWFTVALLLLIYTCSFVDRTILNLLINDIQADLKLDDKEFGLITGIAFGLCYAVFGLVFSRFADTKSRKGLIAIGLFLWSLATAFSAFARNFTQLFLMRMGVGVGESALAPAASSMIADSFPKHKLGFALSVYTTGVTIGVGLAYLFGAYVIKWSQAIPDIPSFGGEMMANWQKVFLIVGLPGFILAILILLIKEPSRKGLTHKAGKAASLSEVITQYKKYPRAYTGVILGLTGAAFLSFGIMGFLTKFITKVHNIPAHEMGQNFGIIVMIFGTAGLLLGGKICDRMVAAGRKDAALIAMVIAPVGYLIPSLTFPLVDNINVMWGILAFHMMFINLSTGVGYAAINMLTPNEMRGQFTALFVMVVGLFGAATGPYFIGLFNQEFFTGDAAGLGDAFVLLSVISTPFSIWILMRGRKQYIQAQDDQSV